VLHGLEHGSYQGTSLDVPQGIEKERRLKLPPQRLKARFMGESLTARLKACPDTNRCDYGTGRRRIALAKSLIS
jgi:hypothetical protein